MSSSEFIVGGQGRPNTPRFLAYALPHAADHNQAVIHELEGFDLHDVPLKHANSFLDYSGVVLFAGAFEETVQISYEPPEIKYSQIDLDRREREFHTLFERHTPVVFLVPQLPDPSCEDSDLFRRILAKAPIYWDLIETRADLRPGIADFRTFFEKHAVGFVRFSIPEDYRERITVICGCEASLLSFAILDRVFFLPCRHPQTHEDALQMAEVAVECVLAYLRRVSEEMPQWVGEFRFEREKQLREDAACKRAELMELEAQVDSYGAFKGALCFRSNPLVKVVLRISAEFFGLHLKLEEHCIEDATLQDDEGARIAILEIKGVNGNFTRQNVNQVDSHRERLSLPSQIPGILIMNTMMSADSIAAKCEAPHPDIIKKAVSDNVLLIRTLDLLRYADLVEGGKLTKDSFRKVILSERGWLRVDGGQADVIKD